jgi:hypothetical protein
MVAGTADSGVLSQTLPVDLVRKTTASVLPHWEVGRP